MKDHWIQVHTSKIFYKIFYKIHLMIYYDLEIKIFWAQNHEITFHRRILNKWHKRIFQKKLSKENREIISGKSWSSRTEFLKGAFPKKFGKVSEKRLWQNFLSNFANTHSISDSNGSPRHNHLVRKQILNHSAKLVKWLSCIVSAYLYSAFDCMLLSCHVRASEWAHTL